MPPRRSRELAAEAREIVAVVGFPERAEDVFNAAAVLAGGAVHAIYRKVYLPNYGVFDEQRYFQAGPAGAVIDLGAERVGLTVCEDMWEPGPPASDEAHAGATLILNISASPYHAGKGAERERMFAQRARDNLACVAFCALVGGQDELVFDGHSCVIDHTGVTDRPRAPSSARSCSCAMSTSRPPPPPGCATPASVPPRARSPERARAAARAAAGRRRMAVARADAAGDARRTACAAARRSRRVEAEVYAALTLGLRDYVREERLPARRARPLRRHRLGARRLPRRRRARPASG